MNALRKIKRLKAGARANAIRPVRRVGASHGGTMANWNPQRAHRGSERLDRERMQTRTEDIVSNDGHAASIRSTLTTNVAGPGIRPQSSLAAKKLNLTADQILEIESAQEEAFELWTSEAHIGGLLHFADIQALSVSTLIPFGEFCYLCRFLDEPARTRKQRNFSFTLQDIHPLRLKTPPNELMSPYLRDGINFDEDGEVDGYYIHTPAEINDPESYTYYKAKAGHRRRFFHCFRSVDPEQVRGVSILAPVIKLFRDKYDFLDYELIAQIVTASFPIAIERAIPPEGFDDPMSKDWDPRWYQNVDAGQILYTNPGETVNPISSDRPGNNFDPFFKTVIRTLAAAAGLPYHQVIKDFSETNYSSARAALLESWREFEVYRGWLVRHFLQPIRIMVLEEAYLRGYWKIPAGAPGFYEAMRLWTACRWTPPPRGHIDPDKEAKANERAIATGQKTYKEVLGEQGKDWREEFEQEAVEQNYRKKLNLPVLDPANVQTYPDEPEEQEEEIPKTGAA
ncbi:phage portal protein [Maridesulfovibrio ferrireducens]|uniref:phage portal protein n=1 Tax=Maridesulfovibrio ferrireducens TaxID=246191 RepID=UPI001A1B43EB|nr:phage portal protein [Maridesulfovibrio ferrireducens]MBI9112260.1 phage portal protein [Maridesulfovibrio ferrireducens]